MENTGGARGARFLFGGVLALSGFALGVGGAWLLTLGGSPYYLVAGLLALLAGVLIVRGDRRGAWLYLFVTAGTTIWAIFEVGFDLYQLLPRVLGPALFALMLLTPWVWGRLGSRRRSAHVLAGLLIIAPLAVVLAANLVAPRAGPQSPPPASGPAESASIPEGEWPNYGRTLTGRKYSPLSEITPENVRNLKVAWTFETGEKADPARPKKYRFETTPLKVGDTLYLCTAHNVVVALDAETGRQKWRFDPKIGESSATLSCRGVSYWAAPEAEIQAPCARRIVFGTLDARLITLDAGTGRPCAGFGRGGVVDLTTNLGEVRPGFYYVTSPPTIVRNLAILGGWVMDNQSVDEPSGVIRAFDVVTGRLVWNWDAGRPLDTSPLAEGESHTRSTPNSWAPASVDEEAGLIYLPMGNQTPDMWGGKRSPAAEPFTSAVVALDVATGALRWRYQTVHHDLWDLDVPNQPTLIDIVRNGRTVPALYLLTKRGDIFVLDRRTGKLLVPAPERAVPQGAAAGDWTSRTQPFSALSFAPKKLTEADMWGVSPFDQLYCRIRFRQARYDGPFTPPGLKPVIASPGSYGVFNWGGAAVDQRRQILMVNASYSVWYSRLIPQAEFKGEKGVSPQRGAPFAIRNGPFLSPLGLPCQAPSWGDLIGLDLSTNKVIWKRRFGTTRDMAPLGIALPIGMPSMGGPIATASGVAFIGGTMDDELRAIDIRTGRELWRGRLPAGGQSTPMSYVSEASGRQFVVIAAGGHGALGTTQGGAVVAFALPRP